MKEKTAIVISWWGMWASYGVWCILALVHEYWFIQPDIIIAWSGNTWTMSYYVAKQYDGIKNIRANLLSTKKFINFWRFRKVIDIDYLIDDVFKEQDPLNAQRIYDSSIDYYISSTNVKSWKVEYFSNHDWIDIFEIMRASKAMPFVYRRKIKIKWRTYFDTPNSTSTQLKIQKAIALWAKKIIIIDSKKKTPQWILKLILLGRSKEFKNNYWKEHLLRNNYQVPQNIKCLEIIPQKPLKIWILENVSKILNETIDLWYKETKENKNLQKFLMNV